MVIDPIAPIVFPSNAPAGSQVTRTVPVYQATTPDVTEQATLSGTLGGVTDTFPIPVTIQGATDPTFAVSSTSSVNVAITDIVQGPEGPILTVVATKL